jgi:excisionase family DNA binding protein
MEIVTSLTRKELEQIITDSISKCLNDKLSPPQPEQSDRCNLNDACLITGLSKATIYKMSHEQVIPHAKFGNHLVFSRRQITVWMESHTLPSSSPGSDIKANLVKTAKKRLHNV